ncbi:aspartate 1-decarboxylase [Novispirillum itersonii]|uniref:Aspartate 1-decarboxylase n=1 Tax=Novispirillum itersonii TaxID=189 RepID=A0A7X0DQM9_NOVIT|nr:aspartate 1-decarboxylase [Novispirillum itersonii]MBB6212447.1 aspartate 1-decarboxylase [Novispirillum itersonii]
MIKVVRAKLHGLWVTNAELHYHGSITLDPEICLRAGIYPLEFVEIWNKASGARISTYVIFGEPGSRCCILNGAAARTCQAGDEVIIAASSYVQPQELYGLRPKVLTFHRDNSIAEELSYSVTETPANPFHFEIHEEAVYPGSDPAQRAHSQRREEMKRDMMAAGLTEHQALDLLSKHFSEADPVV